MGVVFPGAEQLQYWHSKQADVPGGQNLSGLKDPVVDALLNKIINAETLEELRPAARALDRILLHKHLVIPHWSLTHFRTAYWDKFNLPAERPEYALGFETWWMKDDYR
jgi:microcin C transport system substrate-binding protein